LGPSPFDPSSAGEEADLITRASESVAGFASTLRAKDVDELFQDAREAVKKSPAIAIGAAAAVGFLLARVIKSASSPADDGSKGDGPKGPAA
jgi:ElaB/YqjD/DUF883 family membrane-anchored ribosome-binding protein